MRDPVGGDGGLRQHHPGQRLRVRAEGGEGLLGPQGVGEVVLAERERGQGSRSRCMVFV